MQRTLKLIPEDTLEKLAGIFKALGHKDRLQIVTILMNGEQNEDQIVNELVISQSSVSQHLTKLKWQGILKSRREGNKVYNSLANDSIRRIVKVIKAEIK